MNVPVVVLNLGHTALGIARNLAPLGIPVTVVHHSSEFAIGRGSRCMHIVTGPDAGEAGAALLRYLLDLADELGGRPLLFATRDLDVHFISTFRDRLSERYVMTQPEASVLDSIVEKPALLATAESLGVPVPRTLILHADNLERAREFHFPVIVKPTVVHEHRAGGRWERTGRAKAHVFGDFDELEQRLPALLDAGNQWFLQEFVPGPVHRLRIFAGYVGRDGSLLGHIFARKVLQIPEHSGLGIVVDSAEGRQDLRDWTLAILREVGYWGMFEAEYKLDDDGVPRLIEINTRHWDQHRLATACGVNLSAIAYRELTDAARPSPAEPGNERIRWVDDAALIRWRVAGLAKGRWERLPVPDENPGPRLFPSVRDPGDPWPAVRAYAAGIRDVFWNGMRALSKRMFGNAS